MRRKVIASQKRKGFSQPVRELSESLRCRAREAIHQLSLYDQRQKLFSKELLEDDKVCKRYPGTKQCQRNS